MATTARQNGSSSSEYSGMLTLKRNFSQNWEEKQRQQKDFYDDGTVTFFWRAHTITVLFIFSLVLLYVAIFEEQNASLDYNTKRGIGATVLTFVLFGVTYMPDGPFRRPHPAFWRLILCLSIVYELGLVFLLFQNVDDARQLLKHVAEELGVPLPEKDYGGSCLFYDPDNPENPFHNFWDKMDGFVVVHFFGWWLKTLILRDYWLCTVISIMFEVMEYTLEHQLPNFSECWWDHWLMDALICNGLGIYLGMKTLNYLSMKKYHWRGIWNIPTYSGKLKRIVTQFSPHCWTDFDWKATSSLKRWLTMLLFIGFFLLAELNTFYLKFVLWIPPPHFLCLGRLVFYLFMGAVAMHECFQFLEDPKSTKIGQQTFVVGAIIISEFLVSLKFDWDTVQKPIPQHMLILWAVGIIGVVIWTIWHFYIKRFLHHSENVMNTKEREKLKNGASSHNHHQREYSKNGTKQNGEHTHETGDRHVRARFNINH